MKYLVSMESIETGLLPPQQMAELMEQQILPSIEAVVKLEKEKKILAGGGLVGKGPVWLSLRQTPTRN